MSSLQEIKSALLNPGVIAVIRLNRSEPVLPLCQALLAGGIRALEITLTTPNALRCIREVASALPALASVGAGSVTSARMADDAMEAGAQFIVSPIVKLEVATAAHALGRPVMLGAYTPTEAQAAYEAGADFIKIFPADQLGPAYIKALRGPLPHLQIVPTGGVDLKTIGSFFKAGCVAVGVGSSLLLPALVDSEDWGALERHARDMVRAAAAARG